MPKRHKHIKILSSLETDSGWQFTAAVNGYTYKVNLDKSYYKKLVPNKRSPESLIEESFRYLLTKESPEQILTNFNLSQIQNYFKGFEHHIKNSTQK